MWITKQELLDELQISSSTLVRLRSEDAWFRGITRSKRNGVFVYLLDEIEPWLEQKKARAAEVAEMRRNIMAQGREVLNKKRKRNRKK